jgi:hypothetical protein
MARPEFEDDRLFGVGEAAGGWIRAVVADGRLADLELSPQLMRRGGMDSSTLAAEVTNAVNAALDDLVRQVTVAATPDTAAVAAELDQVNATFTRAIDEVTAELERAERRLYRH